MNRRLKWICLCALIGATCLQVSAQILAKDELKKVVPGSYFFAGQSAPVQLRNSVGMKNGAGKFVLAGLVDTSGYATAIAQKYQGFLITEIKLSFDGSTPAANTWILRRSRPRVAPRRRCP